MRLIDHLDLVAVERFQQVGFELGGGAAGAGGLAIGPDDAAALLAPRGGQSLVEAVEQRIGVFAGECAQQREAGREAQRFGAARDRARDEIGQLLGEELPAFAAAGLVGDDHEAAAGAARG